MHSSSRTLRDPSLMPKPIANSTGFERDASMYVGSRLDFIRRNSKDSVWKWVPGDLNPANLPTRANTNVKGNSCKP